MYSFLDSSNLLDLALWCSFLVAFYCLFRKSNVAPKNLSAFNPEKELSRKKLCFVEEDDVILIYSNHSKSNQFLNRHNIIPLTRNNLKALDPIFHLKVLLSFDISEDKPAFSYSENGSLKCITYDIFTKKLKSLLTLAGYSPELYSGHSMRRGGATLLFQLNCDPLIIQALGDWASDQYLKYIGLSLDQKFHAQRLMCSVTT